MRDITIIRNEFNDLLLKKGLYDYIYIMADELKEFVKTLNKTILKIDFFCPICEKESVFTNIITTLDFLTNEYRNNIPTIKFYENYPEVFDFSCARAINHNISFILIYKNGCIIKIGQYPSIADMTSNKYFKYKSLLKEDFYNYSKAIGLYSHGIGIGSFVYLRRIIENLIILQYEKNKNLISIKEEDFYNKKFVEKINAIKLYLPEILVENKNIYSIVSKGIHELSEEECLKYFTSLQMGIELILDDILEKKEKEKKKKDYKKNISEIMKELK